MNPVLDPFWQGQGQATWRTGAPTILTSDEEKLLVAWVIHVSKCGFPVTKIQLLKSIVMLTKTLQRDTPFVNGQPGRSWYQAFLKRHPELSQRVAQNLTKSRASLTEEVLRRWFHEVETHLKEQSLTAIESTRVFNYDESEFFLSPKGEKVIAKKEERAVYISLITMKKNVSRFCSWVVPAELSRHR